MFIKVCGITLQHDASFLAELGVDFCGFIFSRKSPRVVDPAWVKNVDTGTMKRVGVFVEQDEETVLRIMEEAKLDYAQLHGEQTPAFAREIGAERVIKVFWPDRYDHKAQLYSAIMEYADSCCYYLLDAGLSGGGSGRRIDWEELSGLRLPRPWFLAGGLAPSNVGRAILETHPDGVDFNSGVERNPGEKEYALVRSAIENVQYTNQR